MKFFIAVILGLVQGLTEFLPISSSGHLVIFQKLLGITEPPVFFDVLVHTGTLFAVIFFFKKELRFLITEFFNYLKNDGQQKFPRKIWLILIGTVPAFVAGLFLQSSLSYIFNSLLVVGLGLITTGLILLIGRLFTERKKKIKNLAWQESLFIGLAQAAAIIPGISRSGATVSAGLSAGLEKNSAFEFSFLLSIPAIIGALCFQFIQLTPLNAFAWGAGLIGMVTAFISGIFALKLFKKIFINGKIYYFAVYCFSVGLVLLLLFR
jgi:undecaprenyl-diphosphatase